MKLGLVLEGGASRTYFSVGVMDALLELGIMADYVIGASAGIANATSYVSGQKGRSLEIGLKYMHDKRYMGYRHFLKPSNRSYYNIDFVFNKLQNRYMPFDYAAFRRFDGEVVAAVTNIKDGRAEYLDIKGDDKEWRAIVASCALPLFFTPVRMGDKIYMDGGISDPIPFRQAMNDGCDKLIVVITRERSYIKEEERGLSLCSFLYKRYPEFVEALKKRIEIYNESHNALLPLEQEGKIILIAPENTKGWSRTESKPEMIKLMYEAGYNAALKRLESERF